MGPLGRSQRRKGRGYQEVNVSTSALAHLLFEECAGKVEGIRMVNVSTSALAHLLFE